MKILCFGDSNTWGWIPITEERYPKGVRWPSLLEEYTGAEVIEEGLSGRTTVFQDPDLPYGVGSDYIDACVMTHKPFDLLICMLGSNDLKTYINQPVEAIAEGAAHICNLAKALLPEIKVLLVSPIEVGANRIYDTVLPEFGKDSIEKSTKLAPLYKMHAEKNGFYFLNAAEYAEPSQEDAVHMTAENHKKLAQAIADKLKEIIN